MHATGEKKETPHSMSIN